MIEKIVKKVNWQRLLAAICLAVVCIGTQRIQSAKWDDELLYIARVSIGIFLPLLMMTHYKKESVMRYRKIYLGWLLLWVIGAAIALPLAIGAVSAYYIPMVITLAIGVLLTGCCLIYTVIHIALEGYRPKGFWPLFIIWAVMMVLMICSRSDYYWPEGYFVLFGCYFLTEQNKQERRNVWLGVIDGVIAGFLLVQGHSLLFRPYDRMAYYGNFCNPNHNAMFLCMCLAAILAKILWLTKENQSRLKRFAYCALAAVCYVFIAMTVCTSAYLALVVATMLFLVGYSRIRGKMLVIRMGMFLVTLFVVAFPLTYLAVRYVPTIRPHVVFYFQEGYSEQRVHSWDDRNSDKFTSFADVIENIMREAGIPEGIRRKIVPIHLLELPIDKGVLLASASNKIPILPDTSDQLLVRKTIYKWYFDHLTWNGRPYDEQGFQLAPTNWIQDTHNIYLDYGINFGWPTMILFTVFIWWGIVLVTRNAWREKRAERYTALLFLIIPPVFGLFEFSWGTGMLSTVAFYLAFKEIFLPVEAPEAVQENAEAVQDNAEALQENAEALTEV